MVSTSGMVVSLKTESRFPFAGQHVHGSRIIQYIIGFAVGAFVTGVIAHKSSKPGYPRLLTANFAGLAIVYIFGMIYYYMISDFYLGTPIGLWPLFLYCFILTVPGDILLCIIGAILGKRLIPLIKAERI